MAKARWVLAEIVARLREAGGPPPSPPTTDILELILWENVAYLADEAKRREAFERLRAVTDFEPSRIAALSDADLRGIVAAPGRMADNQVKKLRDIAELVLEKFDGSLEGLREMSATAARKALRKFPAIGEPGADKILLLSGLSPAFTLESNGLRVLVRCGYGTESTSYAATLASVLADAGPGAPRDLTRLRELHFLLRRHGQDTCTRSAPSCGGCPLRARCPSASRAA